MLPLYQQQYSTDHKVLSQQIKGNQSHFPTKYPRMMATKMNMIAKRLREPPFCAGGRMPGLPALRDPLAAEAPGPNR